MLGIIIAVVVSMALGMFWYSPSAFGNQWCKEMGYNKAEQKKMAKQDMKKPLTLQTVGMLLMAWVLSEFTTRLGVTDPQVGAQVGAILFLGFSVPMLLGGMAWERKSQKLTLINGAHWLIVIALMGAIVVAF